MVKKFLRNLVLSEKEQKALKKGFNFSPIGSSGTENYAGYTEEEYLETLKGSQRAKVYDRMRRSDTQVKMNLSAVKNPIKSANWFIKDPDPDYEMSNRITDFVNFVVFEDMDNPFTKFLREALTMIEFGNALFEVTHKAVLNHPIYGSYNGLLSVDWRSPKTIERWNLDKDTGRLVSVDQYAYGDLHRLVTIPSEFLVSFAIDVEGSNYEGISMLRPCYGPWLRKDTDLKINAIGKEKFAVPTPLAKIPSGFSGTEDYDNLVSALENYVVHENNYLIYPEGVEINLNTNVYDPQKVEVSIQNEDKRMTKAFLANFLELGTGGSGGAYALSEDLSDFFVKGIEYIADEICEKFNRSIIRPLVDSNFGKQSKYPELSYSDISDKVGQEFSTMLRDLASSSVIRPDDELEKHIRTKMKLPEANSDTAREVNPAPAPQEDPGQEPLELSLSEKIIKAAYGN